jgi:hypothetical protein
LVLVNMERSSLTSPSVVATAVFIHGLLASLDLVGAALHHVDLGPEPPLRLDGPDASAPSLCPRARASSSRKQVFPTVTGLITAVTAVTGPDRQRYQQVGNNPNSKFSILK